MIESTFETHCEFAKSAQHGMVFGFAIVCTVDGEPFIDLQKDHTPDEAMLNATVRFAKTAQVAGVMHLKDQDGNKIEDGVVPFLFPLTEEIAESMGIECAKTGLLVGLKPSEASLSKFMDGTYTGFSIGGSYGLAPEDNEEVALP